MILGRGFLETWKSRLAVIPHLAHIFYTRSGLVGQALFSRFIGYRYALFGIGESTGPAWRFGTRRKPAFLKRFRGCT